VAAVWTTTVIDAVEPQSLAAFWAEVLGWNLHEPDPEDGSVVVGDPDRQLPILLFLPVEEPKAIKNRVHFDVNPKGCDQEEELGRILALGARKVDIGQGVQTWHVLADPEGNEFCLLRRRTDQPPTTGV
jgi:catechol 2,3-dioxygenase-like lactoylglutathione lyase family enzyme